MDLSLDSSPLFAPLRAGRLAVLVALLLVAACLAGCQPDDTRPGVKIVNDTEREVQIFYEVGGAESLQHAKSGETAIPPKGLLTFRFDFPDEATGSPCTSGIIRARAGTDVVAVIDFGVCAGPNSIRLSEWPP